MALLKQVRGVVTLSLVFVSVLEVSARIDDRLVFGTPLLVNPTVSDLQIVDETGIHGRPHARFQKWHMNSLGVQGPETTLHKPRGAFRVVVLGASESFGPYESPGMCFSDQLQRLLAERLVQRVEVLNASLPGMSLPRVIEFCEERLPSLQPDIVAYYPNPVTYLAEMPPSEVLAVGAEPTHHFDWRFLPKLVNGVNHSFPATFAAWRLDRGQDRALAALRRGRQESWFFRQVPGDRVDLFETHLRKLVACVLSVGARPVLSTHANRFPGSPTPADQVHLVAWQIFYPRAEGGVLLSMDRAANEVVRRVSRESGAALADVAAAVPSSPTYFRDFAHFTDEGSTLVARELLKAVVSGDAGSGQSHEPRPGRANTQERPARPESPGLAEVGR
jgi:hypothetical protein